MTRKGSVCEGVLKAIRSIIRAVDLHSKILDGSCGLTGPQLIILKEIADNGITTTSVLARSVSLSQSTTTTILDRLVAKNLVDRTRDTVDKRKWFISLTEQGSLVLKSAPPLLQSQFIDQFEKLPQWEQSQTLATLQRVVAMLNTPEVSEDSAAMIISGNNLFS